MNKLFFTCFMVAASCFLAISQQMQDREILLSQLKSRGISENELQLALTAEGIDINDLESLTSAQIIRLQEIIDELTLDTSNVPVRIDSINLPPDSTRLTAPSRQIDSSYISQQTQDTIELAAGPPIVPIYGHALFNSGQISVFTQADRIKPPDSYILGEGDDISISIYGTSQLEEKYGIQPDGYIRILNGNQRVLLKGSTLAEAKEKLYRVYSNYYRFNRGQFDVQVSYTRSVRLGVYGEVNRPGDISINAVNTLMNALAASGGLTDKGSVRKIQLNSSSGGVRNFDLYQLLSLGIATDDFHLHDNDIIFVPVQGKIIQFFGAVNRPIKFELLDNEHLMRALEYAGGLTRNAYRRIFRVVRIANNQRFVLDIPYQQLLDASGDFTLTDGDEIYVDSIDLGILNFVEVNGEVKRPGLFEKKEGMRVSDLILEAGLKPQSRTDIVPLIRLNQDSSKQYVFLNLDQILANPSGSEDLVLEENDALLIWSKSRFVDQMTISVDGAVREAGEFPFDQSRQLRVSEAISLSGGLRRDAGNIAIIHRLDPLRPNSREYIRVNLDLLRTVGSDQNIILEPFDRLEILSESFFSEESFVSIIGAVNNPGEFLYGEGMTLADALALARGFKLAAATNNIEVSRIIIRDNLPTKTTIANLRIDRNFHEDQSVDASYVLQPFDQIFVRYVPEFELQKRVEISGEVQFPGPYNILDDNERIYSLIQRAGGLTGEAFPPGARLFRTEDQIGHIVMRLDEVMNNPNSRYNFILKDGDLIEIPKQLDFVMIRGATRAQEMVDEVIIGEQQEITVAFHDGKDAKFYIDFYAGGLADNADKKLIFVEHANGEIKQTKRKFIAGWRYPRVRKGSVITVGQKPPEPLPSPSREEDVNWTKVLGDSVAQAMSILTLLLLIRELE